MHEVHITGLGIVANHAKAGILPNLGLASQVQLATHIIHGKGQQLVRVAG